MLSKQSLWIFLAKDRWRRRWSNGTAWGDVQTSGHVRWLAKNESNRTTFLIGRMLLVGVGIREVGVAPETSFLGLLQDGEIRDGSVQEFWAVLAEILHSHHEKFVLVSSGQRIPAGTRRSRWHPAYVVRRRRRHGIRDSVVFLVLAMAFIVRHGRRGGVGARSNQCHRPRPPDAMTWSGHRMQSSSIVLVTGLGVRHRGHGVQARILFQQMIETIVPKQKRRRRHGIQASIATGTWCPGQRYPRWFPGGGELLAVTSFVRTGSEKRSLVSLECVYFGLTRQKWKPKREWERVKTSANIEISINITSKV